MESERETGKPEHGVGGGADFGLTKNRTLGGREPEQSAARGELKRLCSQSGSGFGMIKM